MQMVSKDNTCYVHCAGGRHRTGAMTAVFRMDMQGWDADQAYGEMKDYDFYTRWGHKAMKKFVFDQYQVLLHQRAEMPKASIAVSASESINHAGAKRVVTAVAWQWPSGTGKCVGTPCHHRTHSLGRGF